MTLSPRALLRSRWQNMEERGGGGCWMEKVDWNKGALAGTWTGHIKKNLQSSI